MTDLEARAEQLIEAMAEGFYVADTNYEWKHAVEGVRKWYMDAARTMLNVVRAERERLVCRECGGAGAVADAGDMESFSACPAVGCIDGSVLGELLVVGLIGGDEHDFQRTIPGDGLWCQKCGLSHAQWSGEPCTNRIHPSLEAKLVAARIEREAPQ